MTEESVRTTSHVRRSSGWCIQSSYSQRTTQRSSSSSVMSRSPNATGSRCPSFPLNRVQPASPSRAFLIARFRRSIKGFSCPARARQCLTSTPSRTRFSMRQVLASAPLSKRMSPGVPHAAQAQSMPRAARDLGRTGAMYISTQASESASVGEPTSSRQPRGWPVQQSIACTSQT
ncbi:hypothetical protein D3C85_1074870 [compost metagenome]